MDINSMSESGCIAPNLPRKFSRVATENKNLLNKKGSMYIGTGSPNTVSVGNESVDVAETESIGNSYGCFKNYSGTITETPEPGGNYVLKMHVNQDGTMNVFWVLESIGG